MSCEHTSLLRRGNSYLCIGCMETMQPAKEVTVLRITDTEENESYITVFDSLGPKVYEEVRQYFHGHETEQWDEEAEEYIDRDGYELLKETGDEFVVDKAHEIWGDWCEISISQEETK